VGASMTMDLEGDKALQRKLEQIEPKLQRKVIRQAVRATGKVVLPEAQANAISMVGGDMGKLLKRHLGLRTYKKHRRGTYAMRIAISPEANDQLVHVSRWTGRSYIPAAIEYGHEAPDGSHVPAIPFMRKAYVSHGRRAVDEGVKTLHAGVEREAAAGVKQR